MFRLATSDVFPYQSSYPVVFALLAFVLIFAALALVKTSPKMIILAAAGSVLALTIFNIYFVHGRYFRNYAKPTAVFWLLIAFHAVLFINNTTAILVGPAFGYFANFMELI